MLREDFNDPASISVRFRVPLEIAMSMFEDGIQFITLEFVRREETKVMGVVDECVIEKVADGEHARCFCPGNDTVLLPVGDLQGNKRSIRLFSLSHSKIVVFRDDTSDDFIGSTVFVE